MAANTAAVIVATMAAAMAATGERILTAARPLEAAQKPAHMGTGQLARSRPGAQKEAGGKKCAGSTRGAHGLDTRAGRPG